MRLEIQWQDDDQKKKVWGEWGSRVPNLGSLRIGSFDMQDFIVGVLAGFLKKYLRHK